MAKLISKTYGDALFEIAVEENKTDLFLEEVSALLQIIKENDEFQKFMDSPKIPKEEKLEMVQTIFKDRLDQDLLGFMITVIEKDRYTEIQDILQYVIDEIKEYCSIGTAYITTAAPLTNEEVKDVEKRLLETTKYKTVECVYQVDSSLNGGMVIRMKDRVVDSSIKTKLEKLERELLTIQLS